MEDHVKYLEDHCRVCGEKLQKANSCRTSFSCIDHKADLQTAFDIHVDVTHNNKQENPPHFCNRKMKRIYMSKVQVLPHTSTVKLYEWSPHTASACSLSRYTYIEILYV